LTRNGEPRQESEISNERQAYQLSISTETLLGDEEEKREIKESVYPIEPYLFWCVVCMMKSVPMPLDTHVDKKKYESKGAVFLVSKEGNEESNDESYERPGSAPVKVRQVKEETSQIENQEASEEQRKVSGHSVLL